MIKVQITDKVGAIFQDGVKHLPGDIIEIPAKSFRPDHYRKLEPETPKEKTVAAKSAEPEQTEEPAAAAEDSKEKDATAEKSTEKKSEKP